MYTIEIRLLKDSKETGLCYHIQVPSKFIGELTVDKIGELLQE